MATLAVIIARAGSKGLAHKNTRLLGDKPLVAWTIEHALASKRIEHVTVSTDCPEVMAIALSYRVTAIDRPPELASDTATVDSAARHAVAQWEASSDASADYIALLYGNVPLRPADLTDRAINKLIETEADSVQSVYPVGKMHPLWMRKLVGPHGDVLENYQPNNIYRRQDLPPVYMLNGGVIAVTKRSLFTINPDNAHAFLGTDRRAVVTGADEVVDIDTELDLTIAQAIVSRKFGVKVAR